MISSLSMTRLNTITCRNVGNSEPRKRQKEFQKKIIDTRKNNLKGTFTDINKLFNSEIKQSKILFDEHVDFLKKEWEFHSTKKNTNISVDSLDEEEEEDDGEDFLN